MKQVDVRPFSQDDLIGFYDGTLERKLCEMDARHCLSDGPAYSYFGEGKLIACAGVRIFWPGVGEAWMAAAPLIGSYKKELMVHARAMLLSAFEQHNLWRIECNVRSDFPGAIRLARHLGFEIEGKRRQYGTDKVDCFIYSIVR